MELLSFVGFLQLPLSRPPKQHVGKVSDALIITEGSRALSALCRTAVNDSGPRSAPDTFRKAPQTANDIPGPMPAHLVTLSTTVYRELEGEHSMLGSEQPVTSQVLKIAHHSVRSAPYSPSGLQWIPSSPLSPCEGISDPVTQPRSSWSGLSSEES
jgi:hypothetical protein